jgi:hypothetical protein
VRRRPRAVARDRALRAPGVRRSVFGTSIRCAATCRGRRSASARAVATRSPPATGSTSRPSLLAETGRDPSPRAHEPCVRPHADPPFARALRRLRAGARAAEHAARGADRQRVARHASSSASTRA